MVKRKYTRLKEYNLELEQFKIKRLLKEVGGQNSNEADLMDELNLINNYLNPNANKELVIVVEPLLNSETVKTGHVEGDELRVSIEELEENTSRQSEGFNPHILKRLTSKDKCKYDQNGSPFNKDNLLNGVHKLRQSDIDKIYEEFNKEKIVFFSPPHDSVNDCNKEELSLTFKVKNQYNTGCDDYKINYNMIEVFPLRRSSVVLLSSADSSYDTTNDKSNEEDLKSCDRVKADLSCPKCEKVYKKCGHLVKHLGSCQGPRRTAKQITRRCELCNYNFSTPASLRRHKMNIHKPVPLSPDLSSCSGWQGEYVEDVTCKMWKQESDELQNESSQKQMEKKENFKVSNKSPEPVSSCPKCEKVYQKCGHLVKHLGSCQGPRMTLKHFIRRCESCNHTFSTPASLRRHKMNIHKQCTLKL